ncbi:MAG: ribonuclease HI family protein [Terriglobia bacterium]|jgi:probable phosphoglycerate mutase
MSNSPEIVAHIDGGSRGNPGPAAYGVAIKTPQGQAVTAFAKFIGETTNNFAEYQGLLAALEYALSHGYPRLRVLTDSELMARQISGRYKVRSPDLKPLHDKAQAMIARLESFSIRHVYREHNREADRLANQALDDAEGGKGSISPSHHPLIPSSSEEGSAKRGVVVGAAPAPRTLPPQASRPAPAKPLCISATFQNGALHPHTQLPLLDGEEVELEICRKKSTWS